MMYNRKEWAENYKPIVHRIFFTFFYLMKIHLILNFNVFISQKMEILEVKGQLRHFLL
jgi:hypothetical protein